VAGLVRDYRCPGYPPEEPLVPHGISVVVNAPGVFRATAAAAPARHLEAARALGADTRGASEADAAELLTSWLVRLMRDCGLPSGTAELGYTPEDLPALAKGAMLQRRLVDNAPVTVDDGAMRELFRAALANW
jgi:alcohol dehydrogenase class IV